MSRAVGRGWATVELDRAEAEVRAALGVDLRFAEAERSRLLGARCRRAATSDGQWIVLLEPDTEGRLPAFLARRGEGWAARWELGDRTRPGTPGPLGPELLARDQPVRGPFRLILTTATIEP
ncbi:MAG TPA: hypothetical protein VFN41_01240 [Candidatus Limnocylindrales bacterium]|nr:hypothetical protein [Candidatus Limnocylindrales bacterium]